MTDKELCERLRAEEHWAIERSEAELKREAADRIEALEAENERLREALWEIEMFTNGYGDVAGIVHKMAGDTRRAAFRGDDDATG